MNWKICITAFVSLLLSAFPQNMIGCGADEDPYDYFTSFFNRDAVNVKGYQPFYYTALLDFYDDWSDEAPAAYEEDPVLQEWSRYCGRNISIHSVKEFVYDYRKEVVDQLLAHISNNSTLRVADSIRNNAVTKCFLAEKNTAALRYLSFAKEIEKFSWHSDWENPVERDSLVLNLYISQATKLYQQETNTFLKDKYAYLQCKLAFYNKRYEDCIRWYDEYFAIDRKPAVQQMALSYKAGSLYHLGKPKQAAYEFSKAFAQAAITHRKKIFLGFLWATDFCNKEKQQEYAALGKTNAEKANILGMFALYGTQYQLHTIKQVYALDPSSPLLPILAVREINKIEEQYLTPMLQNEKGGKALYYSWQGEDTTHHSRPPLTETIQFFETLAKDKALNQGGLYATGAAYLSFINKDYQKAKTLTTYAKNLTLTDKLKDQLQLITLLIMANEKPAMDAERESRLLPAIQWLVQQAKTDAAYHVFMRNFFSQILAQKYEQQNDTHLAALAYGMADRSPADSQYAYDYGYGISFIRNEMSTEQLLKLYELYTKPNKTPYEAYMLQHTAITQDHVVDILGTSYLRNHNFKEAIEWLKKINKPKALTVTNYHYKTDKEITVNVDPFYDYLNDWQRYNKSLTKPYSKLTLAEKLQELQAKADTTRNVEAKSKLYYQLASALYNMSYYGNSWKAVAYERSGSDWNNGTYDAAWKREYYGVYKAKDLYQKAHDLTKNKEFKAACYFMVAKCLQRQIPIPAYNYNDWDQYEKDMKAFEKKFRNNPMFDGFVKQYGTTKFYTYTYTRCSYLRDFVRARKAK